VRMMLVLILVFPVAALAQAPGAKGDQQRQYAFGAAGKEMPYRLYVPRSYDPAVPAPLVVALHGFGGKARVPVQISIGGAENPPWVQASRNLAETMKARGMSVEYVEPAAATHGSMIAPTTPLALAFFAKHRRTRRGN
jgi:hypothetical protein